MVPLNNLYSFNTLLFIFFNHCSFIPIFIDVICGSVNKSIDLSGIVKSIQVLSLFWISIALVVLLSQIRFLIFNSCSFSEPVLLLLYFQVAYRVLPF